MIFSEDIKQLNPFEIKAELNKLFQKYKESASLIPCDVNIKLLDAQQDKKTITKLLFKDLTNPQDDNKEIIKFLLERYTERDELTSKLWDILNEKYISNNVKLEILNFLREIDTNWSYERLSEVVDEHELLDADTKKLLSAAIANPEVQIDFLDFLNSLQPNDKIMLIQSLADDYSDDELANILIPVFLSQPDSDVGQEALNLLGESKSLLAFHALNTSLGFVDEKLAPAVRKNLSKLKMAGQREDNSFAFYKEILSASKPYRFCATFPDGHGNSALIFSRINNDEKIQFVAVVTSDYTGIRDCFGFNEISKFECDTIIKRFYKDEKALNLKPEELKILLADAEKLSRQNFANRSIPYEYICWKNIIADIQDNCADLFEIVSQRVNKRKISDNEFEEFIESEAASHWFLDSEYSSEFEAFLAELNADLKNNIDDVNLDNKVKENIFKIFDETEINVWTKRVLTCAYLFECSGEKHLAEIAFNIHLNKELMQKLYEYIIKRSIYEYYFAQKYNAGNSVFTQDEAAQIVAKIESQWVENV